MSRNGNRSAIAWVAILWLSVPLAAQGGDAAAAIPSPEDLLRQMSAELSKAGSYSFNAEINFDDVLVSGQKIQYAGAADVTVRRPNGIFIDYRDDLSAKRFWYDGKTGTLLDVAHARYSKADLPGDIDAALDQLREKYALALPLADLISTDHFAAIDALALGWGYLGVHDVDGAPAHHIAILGPTADLQLWIQEKGKPLPLKIVITYNRIDEAPQYQAVLMDWKLGAKVPADTFQPDLPEDAQEIQFLVVEGPK